MGGICLGGSGEYASVWEKVGPSQDSPSQDSRILQALTAHYGTPTASCALLILNGAQRLRLCALFESGTTPSDVRSPPIAWPLARDVH
jgi:hypothetical protein